MGQGDTGVGVLVGVTLLAVAVFLLTWSFRSFRGLALQRSGRYGEARAVWLALGRSWVRKLPGSGETMHAYNAAVCLLMLGQLDESIRELTALASRPLSSPLRGLLGSALASAFVLRGAAPPEIVALLQRVADHPRVAATKLLLFAHAKLESGDVDAAKKAALAASTTSAPRTIRRIGRSILVSNVGVQRAAEHMLYGWFLIRTGEPEAARPELERAAQAPIETIYTRRAKELLAGLSHATPLAVEEVAPASSLRPHVLTR
jgi:hypothetical protein